MDVFSLKETFNKLIKILQVYQMMFLVCSLP